MKELLKELCTLPGVSGAEDAVRAAIRAHIEGFCDEIFEDVLGNLIVFKKGREKPEKRVLFSAHMDEVGFIVSRICDDGTLKFGLVGGFDPKVLVGRIVRVGDQKIPGVIAVKAIHLTTKEERDTVVKPSSLSIDIGAKDKKDAEKWVNAGDYVVFDEEAVEFGDGFLKAKAIDDRIGCAVLIKLIHSDLPYDTWFVFTVCEEVGCRGAQTAAHRIEPDKAIVVEGTTAADLPDMEPALKVCRAGGGAVLVFMDRGIVYDRSLFAMVRDTADKAGVQYQFKQYISGATDAFAYHAAGTGIRCAGIAAAVRYIHSPASVVSLKDVIDVLNLAKACTERMEIYYE